MDCEFKTQIHGLILVGYLQGMQLRRNILYNQQKRYAEVQD